MAISFEESLKSSVVNRSVKSILAAPLVATHDEYAIPAYSPADFVEDESWVLSDKYLFYEDYSDDVVSHVDSDKNIVFDRGQINITQEANSQFIPFEMSRYYDGFDLSSTNILFHFVNSRGADDYDAPVNVYYSDTKIRFAWLVDERVTAVEGVVKFEIQAVGANSKGDEYIWKSRPSSDLNVLKSLSGNGVIKPDSSWITSFMSQVTEQVAFARLAAQDASASATAAAKHASDALEVSKGVDAIVNEAKEELAGTIDEEITNKMATVMAGYYTKPEIDVIIANIDISEQLDDVRKEIANLDGLAKFNVEYNGSVMTFYNGEIVIKEIPINSDPSSEWVAKYSETVDEKISAAVDTISGTIDSFNTDLRSDIESIQTKVDGFDATFATKNELSTVSSRIETISSSVSTNSSSIATFGEKLVEIQEIVASVDTSPRMTYEATYEDSTFKLWEQEGDDESTKTVKSQFVIEGGGGSGATSSSLKIEYVTKSPIVAAASDKIEIKYIFSGTDSSGDPVQDGVAVWKVGSTIVATQTILAGENSFDITSHIAGTQKVLLSITDDAGTLVTKRWTVQKIDARVESSFDDTLTHPLGSVSFDYTPYGAIEKTIHFVLDGKEIGSVTNSASGIPMAFTIPSQSHGSHLFDIYMTADINKDGVVDITTEHITKDIIWYGGAGYAPVIGCVNQRFTAKQHDVTNIKYTVYDPATETPEVTLSVDGVVVSNKVLTSNTDTWQFRSADIGKHTLTITCGETVKTLIATIEKLDIELQPVTAGLVFDFNPIGKSNGDADRIWSDGDISMSVSDNFDWINGGYQIDENGDQYFCIKAGTSAVINYMLFADDAKLNGKEFKLVFRTANVQMSNATFLHCMDNTTGSNHIGIQMDVHEANIWGQANSLQLPYSENDIIEFEFNISKRNEAVPMVIGYEDGVSTRPMVYDDSYDFTQTNPKFISLGSDYCDLHIYRFKVYNTSLSARGILNNFIADARNASEMVARYNRNQIYDENQGLSPDILAEKCPWLRVYKLSAPYFTNNKSDKVPGTTIQQIYKNGDRVLDNWICYNAQHSGQGTSSNNYGAAGRNLDFIMDKSGVDGVSPRFVLGDGSEADKITLTRTSVPTAYLNAKVNIASSNNMTNAMLANRYNEFNPYRRPFIRTAKLSDAYSEEVISEMTEDQRAAALAKLQEKVDSEISYIKDTMEFYNCVIFVQETNEDISTHREFADTSWHLYAIGNIGDSKKTDKSRLTDPIDKYECCVEIMDVELPLSDFPVDTMYNAMGYRVDEKTNEKIYTWAKNENLGILYEKIGGKYVLTKDTAVDLNKTYYVDILEHDDFSEDFTYGWRYIYEDGTDEENAEVFEFCKQKWIEFYRFVTTSSDAEFKAHIGDYMVIDTALYNYLFTTRYCMTDNRAKNTFWHYGKTGEVDSDGNPIRKFDLTWGYDMDTSLGLNNYGKQVYRHGLEDIDVDENGEEVFRESDSTFFCRIRDLFPDELRAMFNTLESRNAWHADSFINQADVWQSEFPEELWRLDIERKYIRTYTGSFIGGKGDAQFLTNMCNGRMKYQRRQWERSQEKYMASKYQSSVASSDNAVLRCTVPTGSLVVKPNYKLKLTPYDYMYLNVKYGTQSPIQLRAKPGIEYEIPFDGTSADIVDIYSASIIQSFGDLSACYPATVDTSKASKIKELIIGNSTIGYDNPSLTSLTMGANDLLEILNIENVSGLTQTLDMSALQNLRELYAHGSNIGGITAAPGGKIEIVELPAISSITLKNLMYLRNLDIASFTNLTKLVVENCSTVDLLDIIKSSPSLNRIRVTGVDWVVDSTDILDRLYGMAGIDKSGYNADQSVVIGRVHVPVIRQQQLYNYRSAWPELEISFDTLIEQFAVKFMNQDGSILEIQYVDKGGDAVDPTRRAENPLRPMIASTVKYDYTFVGWDSSLEDIFAERVVTAVYTESLRRYTIKYVSKGVVMQESTGLYGDNIPYTGISPTYTAEESGYVYYLFNRWDKSGFIDGEKTVNAVFDRFEYNATAFDGKSLSDLSPVEIYAMNKLNLADKVITDKDAYTIVVGNDVNYDDIRSELLISEKIHFDGTNHYDTGIQLFDDDRDFVLAIDYEFLSGNKTNAVLAQCYQANGTNGFKLWYSAANDFNGVRMTWGTTPDNIVTTGKREVIVVRHKKGDNNLFIYKSNLDGASVVKATLSRTKSTIGTGTLVFGSARADDGIYENHAIGNINWAKIWFADLGDDVCTSLAEWTHESIRFEACGFRKYYLSDNPSKRCSFSLLASHLLGRTKRWNASNVNLGGWANAELNASLNNRLYNAIPYQIKQLIKRVIVYSSVGNMSSELSSSDCYITIPALIEVDLTYTSEPYNSEGTSVSYMHTNDSRRRAFDDGDYNAYWTRSPNVGYANYIWRVESNGDTQGITNATTSLGVLVEISF